MQYNFDKEVDRAGTNSLKWEFMQDPKDALRLKHTTKLMGENRILPLWVADMDFQCPQPVVDAIKTRADRAIFGYTFPTESYNNTIVRWMKKRHNWKVNAKWICISPGVVPALNMLVRTFIKPGNQVLLQQPIYYPFFSAISHNGGSIVNNALINTNGRYTMDFDDLEEKTKDPLVTLAFLCNPHNPVGRVWTREELTRFGEICLRNNVLVVSDEIHGDLVYRDQSFVPFASISDEFAQNSIICTAPSKTFNLAGLHTANILIPNPSHRSQFKRTLSSNGLFGVSPFGLVGLEAAYNHGEDWLSQVLSYLEANLNYLETFVAQHLPQLKVTRPEGTYLVWIDCRSLRMSPQALKEFMLEKARVYLDEGFIFGPEGDGFERINIACPRSILQEALERIKNAVDTLGKSLK